MTPLTDDFISSRTDDQVGIRGDLAAEWSAQRAKTKTYGPSTIVPVGHPHQTKA